MCSNCEDHNYTVPTNGAECENSMLQTVLPMWYFQVTFMVPLLVNRRTQRSVCRKQVLTGRAFRALFFRLVHPHTVPMFPAFLSSISSHSSLFSLTSHSKREKLGLGTMDATGSGRKLGLEMGIQMPESKVADSGTISGPLVPPPPTASDGMRRDAAGVAVRAACAACSVISMCLMLSSEQWGKISLYGFELPLHSKWSFSDSLEYLVGMTAVVTAHSVLQLVMNVRKMVKKAPVVPSRAHAWVIFAGDQAFAYAMMSAGSAAAGVTNLNRTGIRHSALPNFCKPLPRFCDRLVVSITFAFSSFIFLAISVVLDVLWLSKY